ncbi:MAG: hypothetical protein GAK28_04334 [Luteibacter sp.]|uniref:hypothetical protein n=1 Tax=Luteibacter sp. TaxID=1886636 RepID=UPI00137D2417|nr:hypothetical protein [Luteibacter sp.]KAF1003871.1 MAG: hypothetical protein GAK28_04334 [Luteibacter sp.]
MKFCKLMSDLGEQITQPEPVAGSVSFDARDGKAHAWGNDGKTLLAELVGARVVWIGAAGMRLEGLEPIDLDSKRFRAQSWQVIF